MVKDQHPQAVKEATATILPVWLEAFKVLLNIDPLKDVSNQDNWDGLAVRIQIFRVCNQLHHALLTDTRNLRHSMSFKRLSLAASLPTIAII